ncbi:MAG TPA: c-type cytochrome [Azonexus sp.]
MRKTTVVLIALLSAALASPAYAQRRGKGPAVNGEMIAQSCMGCHGSQGASGASPMPIIGGQNEGYLIDAMKAFQDGSRESTIMGRLAKGYSDAEIAALAK